MNDCSQPLQRRDSQPSSLLKGHTSLEVHGVGLGDAGGKGESASIEEVELEKLGWRRVADPELEELQQVVLLSLARAIENASVESGGERSRGEVKIERVDSIQYNYTGGLNLYTSTL